MKLTKTQRNKILKRKKELALQKKALRKKKQGNELDNDRLQKLLDNIKERELKIQKSIDKKQKTRAYLNSKTKKVGKLKFEEKPIDFVYTDELPTSLRKLKPSSSLSLDLLNNFERRNMVETRKPKPKRYTKIKYRETRQAKNFNFEHDLL